MIKIFNLKLKRDNKTLIELKIGDILKIKNKEEYYIYDYDINDESGTTTHFICPFGTGSRLIRKKYLHNFFELENVHFKIYEKS